MAKAKKRGKSWRCQIFVGKDPETGKNMYKSFTATTKKAAELAAAEYSAGNIKQQVADATVGAALAQYIASRNKILSVTTLRGYEKLQRTAYGNIGNMLISDITTSMLQAWVNQYSIGHSPKTVRNAYNLLVSAMKQVNPDCRATATLPAKIKPSLLIPTAEEVDLLIAAADPELQLPVMLAAKAGLRRSEICALDYDKINCKAQNVKITSALVQDANKDWVTKPPKSYAGSRTVPLPDDIIAIVKRRKKAKLDLITVNPDIISHRFAALRKQLDLPHYRFHDLRHYYASVLLTLGIPDIYIAGIMGHEDISLTKKVYAHLMEQKQVGYEKMVANYFSKT